MGADDHLHVAVHGDLCQERGERTDDGGLQEGFGFFDEDDARRARQRCKVEEHAEQAQRSLGELLVRVDTARPAHGGIAVEHELCAEPHPLVGQVRDFRHRRGHDRANAVNHGIQLLIRKAPRVLEEAGPMVRVVAVGPLEHFLGVRVNVADACEHLANTRGDSRFSVLSLIYRRIFAVNSKCLTFDECAVHHRKLRLRLILGFTRRFKHR